MNGIISGKIEEKQSISDTVPTSVISMTVNYSNPVSIKNYRCVTTFWLFSTDNNNTNYYIFPQAKYIVKCRDVSGSQSGLILTNKVQTFDWLGFNGNSTVTVNFNDMTISVTAGTQFLAW